MFCGAVPHLVEVRVVSSAEVYVKPAVVYESVGPVVFCAVVIVIYVQVSRAGLPFEPVARHYEVAFPVFDYSEAFAVECYCRELVSVVACGIPFSVKIAVVVAVVDVRFARGERKAKCQRECGDYSCYCIPFHFDSVLIVIVTNLTNKSFGAINKDDI